jgi:mono/diheme cytochrome c family protein
MPNAGKNDHRRPAEQAVLKALCAFLAVLVGGGVGGCGDSTGGKADVATGQEIFRHDTFGSERFWTDTLRMHEVIQGGVSPRSALAVGLKVDADALPAGVLATADLDDPATTVELIRLGAVVGLEGTVQDGSLREVGVTCALCHSTVDDTTAPGIGRRLDGHANRDLDPGRILSLSPALRSPAQQAALTSWGPGRYDAYWNHDGISAPVLIPPIYGLRGVGLETYTGEGPISYWNAYVAVTQMGGRGTFVDPRLGIDITASPDLVTPKLPALLEYQLSLEPPPAPSGSFDVAAAERGRVLFGGKAGCATCHAGAAYSDADQRLHRADETGMEPLLAQRGTTGLYRTTPLRALSAHAPYFHDGSAPTLDAVVKHYDAFLGLGLDAHEQADLVEFLASL